MYNRWHDDEKCKEDYERYKDDITKVVLNLLKFFEDESCGQCTPCRVGTEKAVKLLEKNNWERIWELLSCIGTLENIDND